MDDQVDEKTVEQSLDRVTDVQIVGPSEHDQGCLIATTEQGRIWMMDNLGQGFQGAQGQYWYEISTPPGCIGKQS